jgi:hypothetical protein
MKINIFLIVMGFIGLNSNLFTQSLYRNGIFLHHSTGNCIWGPNGSTTSVSQEMIAYNLLNGYAVNNAVTLNETWFPSDDNEWYTWHKIFANSDPNNDIQPYLQNNKVIVIKSCYPSSNVVDLGIPSDTLSNPSKKTVFNYKWHWRSIVSVMQQYPENFFVIWTNAPLVPNATNSQEAELAHQFCSWAKDTLAAGNDPFLGTFPSNIYVFDFFHKLADENGMLRLQYASSTNDSHPNSIATELVAPQFVKEIFNASIAYKLALPVELTLFTISTIDTEILLNWSTATELNNHGFEIQRKVLDCDFSTIAFVKGQGTTTQKNEYSFADKNIDEGKYFYRLKQIDFGGKYEYSQVVEINWSPFTTYKLEQNYPNPFNPVTLIQYSLPKAGKVRGEVFDILGRYIKTWEVDRNTGTFAFEFNGSDFPSGIYFYSLTAKPYDNTPEFKSIKKMILLK